MPIYEYQCRKCGHFEVTQKITGKALSRCPTCKGKVKKLISNTSFQLKGSGWYLTDYARKEKAPSAEAKGHGKTGASSDAGEKPAAEKKPAKASAPESTPPKSESA